MDFHFQFLDQRQNIDSLDFSFLEIRRFFNMTEKLSVSDGKLKKKIAQKRIISEYLALGENCEKLFNSIAHYQSKKQLLWNQTLHIGTILQCFIVSKA